jgi:hypothetical protein
MGGFGSGWQGPKKEVVEDSLIISASYSRRQGMLKAGIQSSGSLIWNYRNGGSFRVNYEMNTLDLSNPFLRLWYTWPWSGTNDEGTKAYQVRLTTTRPRFGGLRWWFICPLLVGDRPCNRRIGKLYLPAPRARYFGCRHCHDLTYTSCQESHQGDALYAMLAQRVGMEPRDVRRILRRRTP